MYIKFKAILVKRGLKALTMHKSSAIRFIVPVSFGFGDPYLESPETFPLSPFPLGRKKIDHLVLSYLKNILKEELFKTGRWQFHKRLFEPKKLSGRPRNGPQFHFLIIRVRKSSMTDLHILVLDSHGTVGLLA